MGARSRGDGRHRRRRRRGLRRDLHQSGRAWSGRRNRRLTLGYVARAATISASTARTIRSTRPTGSSSAPTSADAVRRHAARSRRARPRLLLSVRRDQPRARAVSRRAAAGAARHAHAGGVGAGGRPACACTSASTSASACWRWRRWSAPSASPTLGGAHHHGRRGAADDQLRADRRRARARVALADARRGVPRRVEVDATTSRSPTASARALPLTMPTLAHRRRRAVRSAAGGRRRRVQAAAAG